MGDRIVSRNRGSIAGACRLALCAGLFTAFFPSGHALAQGGASGPPRTPGVNEPKVQDLGGGRFKVGLVEVDQKNGSFQVPGRILRDEPPLEFLVITTAGFKSYESLIEIGASAYEFNLACILIGLDSKNAKGSRFHFDPEPVVGESVSLRVSFEKGGKTVTVDPADLIISEGKTLPRDAWIYTGSVFGFDGQYLAQVDGTAVGFVHDPSSIIEHRTGFLGNYGEVGPNKKVLPAVGERVTLTVKRATGPPKPTPPAASTGGH